MCETYGRHSKASGENETLAISEQHKNTIAHRAGREDLDGAAERDPIPIGRHAGTGFAILGRR